MQTAGTLSMGDKMEKATDARVLAQRTAEIRARMSKAAITAGRQPQEIFLCAVCKGQQSDVIRQSTELPLDFFGENRVQEFLTHKEANAYGGKSCHFIGHLQTNKVKKVVGQVSLIQSVSSLRLLHAIAKEAAGQKLVQDILLELNIADEPDKTGASKGDLPMLLEAAAGLKAVRVRGLMTIPPATTSSRENRRSFSMLRALLESAKKQVGKDMPLDVLSMGMTDSFEEAILEGATIVRIGRGIYGDRK